MDEAADKVPIVRRDQLSLARKSYDAFEKPYEDADDDNVSEHCHEKDDSEYTVDKVARKKLIIASCLCLVFMIAEAAGGAAARSLAIMTDAAHLLTDFASFLISLFALYMASRPATKSMSFGWHRAEVVGAIVSVLLIWVVTGILVYMAIMRIVSNEYEINGKIMLITSAVGVVVNIIMGFTLHQHGHTHGGGSASSHGHSHELPNMTPPSTGDTTPTASTPDTETSRGHSHSNEAALEKGEDGHGHSHGTHSHGEEKKQNINVRAAFIHVVGDFFQSVGVMVAAIAIYVNPEKNKIADPICTFIFSVLVLFTTISILRDTMNVIMEGAPKGLDFNEVKAALQEIPGVAVVHNLRIWSLTVNKTALSAHLAILPNHKAQRILRRARRTVKKRFQISDVTIQLEDYMEEMADCKHCTGPQE